MSTSTNVTNDKNNLSNPKKKMKTGGTTSEEIYDSDESTASESAEPQRELGGYISDEADDMAPPSRRNAIPPESPCPGCEPEMMGNQFAHMVPGGCLYSEEDETDDDEDNFREPDEADDMVPPSRRNAIPPGSPCPGREPDESISGILQEWALYGEDSQRYGWASSEPVHPEYIYRLSGEWKGWSNFLGIEDNASNSARDALENLAFTEWFKNCLNDAGMWREDQWPAGVFQRFCGGWGEIVSVGPTVLVVAIDGYAAAENALSLAAIHYRNPHLVL